MKALFASNQKPTVKVWDRLRNVPDARSGASSGTLSAMKATIALAAASALLTARTVWKTWVTGVPDALIHDP